MRRALIALLLIAGCQKAGGTGGGEGPKPGTKKEMVLPVEVEKVEAREVTAQVDAVGSVEAFERVQVTARVAGGVDAVRFIEGQPVKAGDVLVEIDPRRYALAVRSAKAQTDRAQAAKADAEAGLKRREQVQASSPGLVTSEELAMFQAKAASAAADFAAAQVAQETAELNLKDAYVRAPVGGVLQTRSVTTGQYVQVGTTLATLLKRDPLLLRFKVGEQEAPRLSVGLPVKFTLQGDTTPLTAKVTAVSETADEATRMVLVTAEVSADDRTRARPGSYARVTVDVGGTRLMPVVPQSAVRPSEKGFLAYVVEGNKAKERIVTLGLRTPDGRVEVKEGLKPDEQLVVRGAEALRDGSTVTLTKGGSNPGAAK
jgi:multidrug efflux system membrane fusion protein